VEKKFELLGYIVRCVSGVALCYLLYRQLPQYPLIWSVISVALSTSIDHSNTLAFNYMKANFLGGLVGLALYFIPIPGILLICTGITVTILLGNLFKLETSLRAALAALVVVFLNEEHTKNWQIALQRVTCVLIGCFVALGITLCFNLYAKSKATRTKKRLE
jgi:uncharacterized membrane protein YgaE (UPF0421/DUF939 family)